MQDLPLSAKIELMETLNQAMTADEHFDSPAWHESVLQSRTHELAQPEKWLSVDEIKKTINP
mgnify:FL=1